MAFRINPIEYFTEQKSEYSGGPDSLSKVLIDFDALVNYYEEQEAEERSENNDKDA